MADEIDDGPGSMPMTDGGEAGPTPSPRRRATSTSRERPVDAQVHGGGHARPRQSGEMRLPFVQTNGKVAYLYDADISTVVEVSTERHGDCLILRVRGGEDVWIRDGRDHRRRLSMLDERFAR